MRYFNLWKSKEFVLLCAIGISAAECINACKPESHFNFLLSTYSHPWPLLKCIIAHIGIAYLPRYLFPMCWNTLQSVCLRRASWILRMFQAMDREGVHLWRMTWPTYKLWRVQRMTSRNSSASVIITFLKNMQDPAFMTWPRSCWNRMIVAEKGMQNELLTFFKPKTLSWKRYGRNWKSCLRVFELCVIWAKNFQTEWILKPTFAYLQNKCGEGIQCVQNERGRETQKSNRDVCKRGPSSLVYTPKRML